MVSYHSIGEASVSCSACRETAAKERLAVLKSNDVGAYLKLVQSAKSSRLNQLLSQTDACLNNLAVRLRLKSKPKQAAGHKAATTETMDAGELFLQRCTT